MRLLVDLDISASRDEIQNGLSGRWNKRSQVWTAGKPTKTQWGGIDPLKSAFRQRYCFHQSELGASDL
jgi:hypothetical protein